MGGVQYNMCIDSFSVLVMSCRIRSAQNQKQLNELVDGMKKRGLDELVTDEKFRQLYNKRKKEIERNL